MSSFTREEIDMIGGLMIERRKEAEYLIEELHLEQGDKQVDENIIEPRKPNDNRILGNFSWKRLITDLFKEFKSW